MDLGIADPVPEPYSAVGFGDLLVLYGGRSKIELRLITYSLHAEFGWRTLEL